MAQLAVDILLRIRLDAVGSRSRPVYATPFAAGALDEVTGGFTPNHVLLLGVSTGLCEAVGPGFLAEV